MPLQSDKLRLLRRIPDIRFDEESPGFSKDQVNRVLANLAPLASEIERLQNRLAEAESRAAAAESRLVEVRTPSENGVAPLPAAAQPDFDETLRNTLVSAQRQADLTIKEATDEADRLRNEAEFQSSALLADARDQSAEMTTEAVAYRERLMAEAVEDRAKRLEEARDEADNLIAEVKKELVDANQKERDRLIAQIEDLQDKHKQLQGDVDRFEDHLKSRSDEVRNSVVSILAVLDEPELLRVDESFEPADLTDLDRDEFPETSLSIPSRDELGAKAEIAAESVTPQRGSVEVEDFDQLGSGHELATDDTAMLAAASPVVADLGSLADEPHPAGVDVDTVATEELVVAETTGLDFSDRLRASEAKMLENNAQPQGEPEPATSQPLFNDDSIVASLEDVDEPDNDRYTEELRRATSEDPGDDAISDFLEDKPDRSGGGWFGRRR